MSRAPISHSGPRIGLLILVAALVCACHHGGSPTPGPTPTPTGSPGPSPSPSPTPGPTDPPDYVGPASWSVGEYQLPAAVDPDVLAGVTIEDWAAVWIPTSLYTGPRPIVVMLHGNHDTCGSGNPIVPKDTQYTVSGTCPTGEFVIQNHRGYDYLAQRLASWGFVVVSINANRGITGGAGVSGDNGLVLARGRLILRHLALLSQWNSAGGTPASLGFSLQGMLDFGHVGLFGHSRSGEGVRAAYDQYNDPGSIWPGQIGTPIGFQAIFEVGPVDGDSSRVLDALGVAWNALLPMCDGDVIKLEGRKPYDRMLNATSESAGIPKSLFAVWGANHDFYNTEWQNSDSTGCVGTTPIFDPAGSGSTDEQTTAIAAVVPFFQAYVGAQTTPGLAAVFNPFSLMPEIISAITYVDRAYVTGTSTLDLFRVETFTGANGTGSLGEPEQLSSVTVNHMTPPFEDTALKAAEITWSSSGSGVFYQDNFSLPGGGVSIAGTASFDFRIARANNGALNPSGSTDMRIQLVLDTGALAPAVSLSQYHNLVGPIGELDTHVGGTPTGQHLTSFLDTVRIPIGDLVPSGTKRVSGVRFTFDSTASGDIYLSDIDLSDALGPIQAPVGIETVRLARALSAARLPAGTRSAASALPGRVRQVRQLAARPASDGSYVLVEVQSTTPFVTRDALPVLNLNDEPVAAGGASETGDPHFMTFRVPADVYEAVGANAAAEVTY